MLTLRMLLRYGIFGIPLAFVGLPIYVHVPKFYADVMHMNLGELGGLLLILRLFDAFSDPIVGMLSDHHHKHARSIMAVSAVVLVLGYIALFNPLTWGIYNPIAWLVGSLTIVYLSFSTLMINYYAMGVDMGTRPHDHTRIASFREGSMLVGVLLASVLPSLLQQFFSPKTSYGLFSLLLAPIAALCGYVCLSMPKLPRRAAEQAQATFLWLLAYPQVRWVMIIGFLNSIPTAITSTLFLFFAQDVLHLGSNSGWLLGLYFLSAACGMPFLTYLSGLLGKRLCLLIAMITSIGCFAWTYTLGSGDIVPFTLICFLSGLTLGADMMLLPSLLADALTDKREASATGFGLWNFASKISIALAAGISLPMLAQSGYHSGLGNSEAALRSLSFAYAIVPCLFKGVAAIALYLSPLDKMERPFVKSI